MGDVMTGATADIPVDVCFSCGANDGAPCRPDCSSVNVAAVERLCALAEEHDSTAPRAPWTFMPDGREVVADGDNHGILRGLGGMAWESAGRFAADARASWPALAKTARALLNNLRDARAKAERFLEIAARCGLVVGAALRARASLPGGELAEAVDDLENDEQTLHAADLVPLLEAAWSLGEHTGDCEVQGACSCWLGDVARSGAFGEKAQRHAETQAAAITDDDVEEMITSALDVLADPATLDEILDCTNEDAIANARGMEPSEKRVAELLEMLVEQGAVVRAGERDGQELFALPWRNA